MKLISVFFLICIFHCATPSIRQSVAGGSAAWAALRPAEPGMVAATSDSQVLAKADSLFQAGDFFVASIAYERAFYQATDMHVRTLANLGKVQANKQLGNYQKALDDIQRSLTYTADPEVRLQVIYEAAMCAYLAGAYRESLMHIHLINHQYRDKAVHKKLRLLEGLNLVQLEEWDNLIDFVNDQTHGVNARVVLDAVASLHDQLDPEARPTVKKPQKARLLSTFIPGMGHLYAGDPGKAFLNASSQALSLGTAALLLLNGYYIGTVTLGLNLFQSFYFGGIRQAGTLAESRNERMTERYKRQLSEGIIELERSLVEAEEQASQASLPGMLEETFMAIYAFKLAVADSISKQIVVMSPDHYLAHFARANYYWWMMISGASADAYEKHYKTSISQSLAFAGNHLATHDDPADLFYLITMYAMNARLDVKNGAYIRALRHGRGAINHVEQSQGLESIYQGFYLTSGLYHYITVKAGQRYPFLKIYSLFYPEGNLELGLSQLHQATRSDYVIWQTEAHYFLMRIYLEMENEPRLAQTHATWLTSRYPSNLIFQYYHLEVLNALGDLPAVQKKKADIRQEAARNHYISAAQRDYFLLLIDK